MESRSPIWIGLPPVAFGLWALLPAYYVLPNVASGAAGLSTPLPYVSQALLNINPLWYVLSSTVLGLLISLARINARFRRLDHVCRKLFLAGWFVVIGLVFGPLLLG